MPSTWLKAARASPSRRASSYHSVSASAIEKIRIEKGDLKPIRIGVLMNNSAGIFQIDELLKNKLESSGLEPYVEVEAVVEGETEKKLIHKFRI